MTAPGAVWHGIAPSRSADAARQYLGEFDGTLMVDGYGVYDTLEKENDALLLAHCWAHARRKFVEAERTYPQCTEALTLIGELFAIDRTTANPSELEGDAKLQASEARLPRGRRERLRFSRSSGAWALEQRGLPKSGLRKAIDYMLRYWPGLTVFVDDPYVPLDSDYATERALRSCHAGMMRYRDRTRAYLDVRPRCPRAAEGNASLRRRRDVALEPAQDPNRPALTTAVCGESGENLQAVWALVLPPERAPSTFPFGVFPYLMPAPPTETISRAPELTSNRSMVDPSKSRNEP